MVMVDAIVDSGLRFRGHEELEVGDLRFEIRDSRFQISDLRFEIRDSGSGISSKT
jgi:hypothetical protein